MHCQPTSSNFASPLLTDRILTSNMTQSNSVYSLDINNVFSGRADSAFTDSIFTPPILITGQNNDKLNLRRRVTLKIDVSHLHHSHIIGKGGKNVKTIAERTRCNIHFPDSNRANIPDKSNQVFITGHVPNINEARKLIRSMLPIDVSFQVILHRNLFYASRDLLQVIEKRYNIEANIRCSFEVTPSSVLPNPFNPPTHQFFTVHIKGFSFQINVLQEAMGILLQHFFTENSNNVKLTMHLEIDPRHQNIMLNSQINLVKEVLQMTGTELHFPDTHFSPNGGVQDWSSYPSIESFYSKNGHAKFSEKSTVTLYGHRDGIFRARQILIENLPVTLMFDVTEEECNYIRSLDHKFIRNHYDVFLNMKFNRKYEQRRTALAYTTEKNMINLISLFSIIIHENEDAFLMSDVKEHIPINLPINCLEDKENYPSFYSQNFQTPLSPQFSLQFSPPYSGDLYVQGSNKCKILPVACQSKEKQINLLEREVLSSIPIKPKTMSTDIELNSSKQDCQHLTSRSVIGSPDERLWSSSSIAYNFLKFMDENIDKKDGSYN